MARSSIQASEVEKFSKMADAWWDEKGDFWPLHRLNPVRIAYIRDAVKAQFPNISFEKLSLLDVGCGGGLLCEPMARLGFQVTGIDASEKNIKIAKLHAKQEELSINYRCTSAEELVESVMRGQNVRASHERLRSKPSNAKDNSPQQGQFDIILAMEIIEHVADVPLFCESLAKLVKPGGLLFLATLNRTPQSFLFAIVGAEYVLRWLPRGTHEWKKFLKPSEVIAQFAPRGVALEHLTGVQFMPLSRSFALHDDVSVNYMMKLQKSARKTKKR